MRLGVVTGFSVAVDVVLALASVLSMPWLVRGLGNEQYGALALVTVLGSQLAFLQLGVPSAVVRCLAEAHQRQAQEKEAIESSSWLLGLASASLAAGGAAALSTWGSAFLVARAQLTTRQPGFALTTALVLGAQPLVAIASAVLIGSGKFASGTTLRLLHGLPRVLIPAILARLGWNLHGVLLTQGAIDIAAVLVVWRSRQTSSLRDASPSARWHYLRRLLTIGLPLGIAGLLAAPLTDFEKVTLAATHTVGTLPYYSVPYGVTSRLMAVAAAFSGFLLVRLTAAYASGDNARARTLLDSGDRIGAAIVSLPSIALIALAPELLTLWLGSDFAARSTLPSRILLVGVVFNASAYAAQAAIRGVAPPYILPLLYGLEIPFYVGVALLTVGRWGPEGAALAWSIRTAVDSAALHLLARRSVGGQLSFAARTTLPGVLCAAFATWAQINGDCSPAYRLAIAAALQATVLRMGLTRQDWDLMIGSLRLR